MAGERRGLLRPLRPPLRPWLRPEGCRDPNVVVLLLFHGPVVGGLRKAEVVVRDPLTAKVTNCRYGPGGPGLVELAARAVGAVEVGIDQIWSKALLKYK